LKIDGKKLAQRRRGTESRAWKMELCYLATLLLCDKKVVLEEYALYVI
jgi:hypothetical protein